MVRSARSHQTDVGVAFLDEAEGRVLLAQGEVDGGSEAAHGRR